MVQFRIARSVDDKNGAIKLVNEMYSRYGYVDLESGQDSKISTFLAEEGTVTMLAEHDSEIAGTISVVPDSEHGLPMDIIYYDELAPYRIAHKKILEVCQFAVNKKVFEELEANKQGKNIEREVSVGLIGLCIHYALQHSYDFVCFTINPKHRSFYESFGCARIGEEKEYPSVSNAPALAYALDIHELTNGARHHFLTTKILQTPPPPNFFHQSS